jgi:hypothetical protein
MGDAIEACQERLAGRRGVEVGRVKKNVVGDDIGVEEVVDQADAFEHKNPLTPTRRTIVAE